jgi:hypothetical protein
MSEFNMTIVKSSRDEGISLNNTHFSKFNCGVICHGRERERERERRVGSSVSELNKTFKKDEQAILKKIRR